MDKATLNLTFRWNFSQTAHEIHVISGIFASAPQPLVLSQNRFEPLLAQGQSHERHVIVVGSPIAQQQVDRQAAVEELLAADDMLASIRNLDGEFLVFVWSKKTQTLQICNDRFSSYPLFWAFSGQEFCCSYSPLDLQRYVQNWAGFALRRDKAYEFFVLNRLLGTGTHDTLTHNIRPGSCLTVARGAAPTVQAYWQPDYRKSEGLSFDAQVDLFTDLFSRSVRTRSAHNPQDTGIFLSGGHDSRLVATYAPRPAHCFTLSLTNNLEVNCAGKIAALAGHDFTFCKLDPDYFEKSLHLSTEISGGLFTTDHALFLPQWMTPQPQAQVLLHGHGLDYMYQGMYLHAQYRTLFNRPTYIRCFTPLPEDIPSYFLAQVSFRQKYRYGRFLRTEQSKDYHEALRATAESLYTQAKAYSDDPNDHWEYMILHQISKHYTFSNVLSKRICGEVRTPSFDNALYAFYMALPYRYRLHGNVIRAALKRGNPAVAHLFSSNHGLPAAWGPYERTGWMMARKILRHMTLNRCFRVPEGRDRTWPDRGDYFLTHPSYLAEATAALRDTEFQDFYDFIDWKKLRTEKDAVLAEPLGGAFWATIMSYYRFYKSLQGS